MLPASTSCNSGFQRWVRDLSIRETSATPRRPSVSPSPVTSSRPPAPPPMTMMRCGALTSFLCLIFRLLRLHATSLRVFVAIAAPRAGHVAACPMRLQVFGGRSCSDNLMLHLNDLLHRDHVVIEIGHDPQ